jgi:hypothetical protein
VDYQALLSTVAKRRFYSRFTYALNQVAKVVGAAETSPNFMITKENKHQPKNYILYSMVDYMVDRIRRATARVALSS